MAFDERNLDPQADFLGAVNDQVLKAPEPSMETSKMDGQTLSQSGWEHANSMPGAENPNASMQMSADLTQQPDPQYGMNQPPFDYSDIELAGESLKGMKLGQYSTSDSIFGITESFGAEMRELSNQLNPQMTMIASTPEVTYTYQPGMHV